MSVPALQASDSQLLDRCDANLAAGDWSSAAAAAEQCLTASPGLPEALERFARAVRWLDRIDDSFAAREQAFSAYRERGDVAGAARMASTLAFENVVARHEVAVANGWFARAHELLAGADEPGEFGWLRYREAQVARYVDHDLSNALALASEAEAAARAADDVALEAAATAAIGVIQVSFGEVEAGMTKLDKAGTAVISGEVEPLEVAGTICCDVIFACEQVRDTDRAREWLRAASRIGEGSDLTPLIGACQVHYATILMWEGDWPGAERALDRARRAWDISGQGFANLHLIRLAQLRTIQGRHDDAWAICETLSWVPAAKLEQARIAYARGDAQLAHDLLGRFFRSSDGVDRQTMSGAWALRVCTDLARGDQAGARAAADGAGVIAAELQTASLRAAAALASGRVAAAAGDLDDARNEIERAIDLWMGARAPYDAASARVALAEVLVIAGDEALARDERERAESLFRELGAPADPADDDSGDSPLTPREREVLALVADGHGDDEIAERLFLSPHTVHRHVANIRLKLDQPTRAAAVADAARMGLI